MSPIKCVLGNTFQITLLRVYSLTATAQVFFQHSTHLTVFQVQTLVLKIQSIHFIRPL